MADLTTLANAKSWLQISGAGDDALITRLITASSNFLEKWLGYTIASAAYTETRDGLGGVKMMFANVPVTAVASLTVGGMTIPASTGPTVPGYSFKSNRIAMVGGKYSSPYAFSAGISNVVVTYTAGYASTPLEIEQACIELVALRYKERDHIGQDSKSSNGEAIGFSRVDLSGSATAALKPFRRVFSV